MDIISIKRLRVDTFVGVYAHEQDNKQTIYIDLSIQMDASAAFASDDLQDALDYQMIADELQVRIATQRFQLIESVCALALSFLAELPQIHSATVTVHKPSALASAEEVSVERHMCFKQVQAVSS